MNNGVRISSSNFIMLYGVTSARMKYRLLVFCMKRWISINNMWAWNNNKKYYYRSSRNMVLHLWQLSDLLISFLESDCWNYSKFSYQVQEHVSLLIQYKLCCMFPDDSFAKLLSVKDRQKVWKVRGGKKQEHNLYVAWGIIKQQSNNRKRDSELWKRILSVL